MNKTAMTMGRNINDLQSALQHIEKLEAELQQARSLNDEAKALILKCSQAMDDLLAATADEFEVEFLGDHLSDDVRH